MSYLTKAVGLEGFGLEIAQRVPLETTRAIDNARYLKTKQEKLNHIFATTLEGAL